VSETGHEHPVDPARVAAAQARLPSSADAERMTALLGLLADPVRARLLYALDVAEELCVGDLALALGVNEDQAGYGLRVLRGAGLVTRRKEGRAAFYRLAEGFPQPLREHCLRRLVELTGTPTGDDDRAGRREAAGSDVEKGA
jgi:DNA-binding transcriptional ArsR family regulator